MNIGKIDAERNKQEKKMHMQQSSDGTCNLAWKGMKLNMNKPCLGRRLHDESLLPEAAGARWHTSTSYHHASKTKRNAACERTKDESGCQLAPAPFVMDESGGRQERVMREARRAS
jgi:hypothetical protein